MKKSILLSVLSIVLCSISACSNSSARNQNPDLNPDGTARSELKTSAKRVEKNAGGMLNGVGHEINKGVDALDKSWKTPEEQRRGE